MGSQSDTEEPVIDVKHGDDFVILFNPVRSSRYSFATVNLHPPGLKSFAKELGKLARKHRKYSGVGLPERNHLLGALTQVAVSEIRSSARGAADDVIRSCINAGIIIVIEDIDRSEKELLYDRELMEAAVSGISLPEPTSSGLLARAKELLKAAERDEFPPESDVNPRTASPPKLDEALLALVDASREIQVDKESQIEGYLQDPLGHLKRSFPRCSERDLETLVIGAIEMGHLTVVGPQAFIIDLSPRKARLEEATREFMEQRMRLERLHTELEEFERMSERLVEQTLDEALQSYLSAERAAEERITIQEHQAIETLESHAKQRLALLLEPLDREYAERKANIAAEVERTLEEDTSSLSLLMQDLRSRALELIRAASDENRELMRRELQKSNERSRSLYLEQIHAAEERVRQLEIVEQAGSRDVH